MKLVGDNGQPKKITTTLIDKIHIMKKSNCSPVDIACLLEISVRTVNRISTMIKFAENGDFAGLISYLGNGNYKGHKQYIANKFNLSSSAIEVRDDEIALPIQDSTLVDLIKDLTKEIKELNHAIVRASITFYESVRKDTK